MPWTPSATLLALSAMQIGAGMALPDDLLGVKIIYVGAGFVGAIVSFGFARYPNILERVVALLSGAALGYIMVPLISRYCELNSDEGIGIAFLLGLIAMPLLGGAHGLAKAWRDDPERIIRLIFRARDKGK